MGAPDRRVVLGITTPIWQDPDHMAAAGRLLLAALLPALLIGQGCGRTDRIEALRPEATFVLFAPAQRQVQVGAPVSLRLTLEAAPAAEAPTWSVADGVLPEGLALQPDASRTSATITGAVAAPGAYSFRIAVRDDLGRRAEAPITLTAVEEGSLRIVTESLPEAQVELPYEAFVEATGGRPPYRWSVVEGSLPTGLQIIDISETQAVIVGVTSVPASRTFVIQAEDADQNTAQRALSIQVIEDIEDLRIVTDLLPPAELGAPYQAEIRAAGGVGAYRWRTLGPVPPGLFVSSAGTPATTLAGSVEEPGQYEITIEVSDGQSAVARDFVLEAVEVGPRLRLVTTLLPMGRVGEAYRAELLASGGAPPYRWRLRQGTLPRGLILSTNGTPAGTISGTPQISQTSSFVVEVVDSLGETASRPFTLTTESAFPPLALLTTALPNGNAGRAYAAELEATGGQPPYEWAVTDGQLPPGLNLSPTGTPRATLAGQLQAEGSFSFQITLADQRGATVRRAFVVTVGPPPTPPMITTATIAGGFLCEGFDATISLSGGFGALTWTVSTGSLPPGLELVAVPGVGARIQGYPNTAGTYPFQVRVEDALGQVALEAYSIQIQSRSSALPPRWAVLIGRIQTVERRVFVSDLCAATPSPAIAVGARVLSSFVELSSDNRSLAFISDLRQGGVQELYVVDLTGPMPSAPQVVHPPGNFGRDVRTFAYSPDGRYLAFAGDLTVDGRTEVWTVDVSNPSMPTNARVVSSPPVANVNTQPTLDWSPDSQLLAYRAVFVETGRTDLYVTTPGSTTGHSMVSSLPDRFRDVLDVAWSPASDGLAYVADQDADNEFEAYYARRIGQGLGAATRVSAVRSGGDVRSGRFGFSANGQIFAYVANQDSFADELYAVRLGAVPSAPQKLHPNLGSSQDVLGFVWSPTLSRLVYVADQEQIGKDEAYLVDLTGPVPTAPTKVNLPLSSNSDVRVGDTNLAWSPDGAYVAFLVNDFNVAPNRIMVSDVRTGTPQTRFVDPMRTNQNLDARGLVMDPTSRRVAIYGELRTAGVTELFVADLRAPQVPVRVNPTMVQNGDVLSSSFGVAWRGDGSGLVYIADQATDLVNEAWSVPLPGGVPGAATRLHQTLQNPSRIERILVQSP